MASSNYLVNFLQDVDKLISEINKLDSRTRLYRKNCEKFGMNFDVKFSISPESFVDLRGFLEDKIDNFAGYDKKIVDLRRVFLRDYSSIYNAIQRECERIDETQETEINAIVYRAVYNAKIANELKLRDMFDVKSSFFDMILGVKKYRKLAFENHDLKAMLLEKEYGKNRFERKSIFELVCLIEACEVKTGSLLCLEEDIIKAFMIDRNVVKSDKRDNWRQAVLVPHGFGAKRQYYRVLNDNLARENLELSGRLKDDRSAELFGKGEVNVNLARLNSKLGKIVRERAAEMR